MAKRACSQKDNKDSIDRISMLPDELLGSILSSLTLKEATITSILSRRWRYVWALSRKLDFDGTTSLLKVMNAPRNLELALDEERCNYVGMVDDVIALHKASTIEEFRVLFNLTKAYRKRIDKWLRFALARKVHRLELNLTTECSNKSREYDECYNFPYELLCNSFDFKFLKKLSTHYVNVNGEAVEFFLRNCPLLEHLSISQSGDLSTLKIIRPSPSFKCLEISLCHNLKSVEIRDANLVYLKYIGWRIHFLLKNVPLLVEMCIGGKLTDRMEDVPSMFSSCLPQLKILVICRCREFSWEETEMFHSARKMSNLKILVVKISAIGGNSFLPLTNLIRASPCLQKFVLEASHSKHSKPDYLVGRMVNKIVMSYPHLEEVEFVGYRGVTSDLELIMHFVENVITLKNIIVDPRERERPLCYMSKWYVDTIIGAEMNARTYAKQQLTEIVPPGVNLNIL